MYLNTMTPGDKMGGGGGESKPQKNPQPQIILYLETHNLMLSELTLKKSSETFNKVYETKGEIITSVRVDTGSLCSINISHKNQPSPPSTKASSKDYLLRGSHKLPVQSLSP